MPICEWCDNFITINDSIPLVRKKDLTKMCICNYCYEKVMAVERIGKGSFNKQFIIVNSQTDGLLRGRS